LRRSTTCKGITLRRSETTTYQLSLHLCFYRRLFFAFKQENSRSVGYLEVTQHPVETLPSFQYFAITLQRSKIQKTIITLRRSKIQKTIITLRRSPHLLTMSVSALSCSAGSALSTSIYTPATSGKRNGLTDRKQQ